MALVSDPLTELADKYDTDKGNKGAWSHQFTPFYHKHLNKRRPNTKKLLEVGIQEFRSHRMWQEYFPGAKIYGMDCSKLESKDGIEVFVGDQANRKHLDAMMQKFGGSWDIIIDDGGHTMKQQQVTFACLFPFLRNGGVFVIEDLHSSNFGKQFGVKPDGSNSTLNFLKNFRNTVPGTNEYITKEEHEFLLCEVDKILIDERGTEHVTSIIWKKKANKTIFKQIYKLIVELRNYRNVDENYDKFKRIVGDNIDEVTKFNVRWLVSVVDTFADFGNPVVKRNAFMISLFVNIVKIGDTVFWNREPHGKVGVVPTFNGLNTVDFNGDNMLLNLSARLNRIMKETPVLWKIWQKIIRSFKTDGRTKNANFIKLFLDRYSKPEWFFEANADEVDREINEAIYNTPAFHRLNKMRMGG